MPQRIEGTEAKSLRVHPDQIRKQCPQMDSAILLVQSFVDSVKLLLHVPRPGEPFLLNFTDTGFHLDAQ